MALVLASSRPRNSRLLITVLCVLSLCGLPAAFAQSNNAAAEAAQTEQQLQQLQREIQQSRQRLERRQERLSRSERELRQLETQVQQAARALQATDQKIQSVQSHITELEQEQARLQSDLEQQAQLLSDQIESAYRNGDHSFLKMLLNQQSPARFERMLAYYGFLNEARLEQLEKLHALEQQLADVQRELQSQQQALQQTRQQQERQRTELAAKQREQQQLVARLEQEQRSEQAQLDTMLRNEQDLTEMLTALQEVMSRQPFQLAGLSALRGQLSWPVQGNVRHNFGDQRSGQVRWRGVVLDAAPETEVKAIADGRVIYSDWLRGYGMVVVIDHGEGDMSLYGYNQALLKNVGEGVRRGETIALVGQSGGQREPGLYFEIRQQGNPINPRPYIRR
ncbi:peptidoglycan DD-metalloendopeptidase family protein [Aliidiomarina halalkaliphila]|uniref:Peptidoglycan DD-metalloendopeptidase family protein n=1 Tax=Aliidiomarina halalkaliphila TaxID=2593535 RepID=A0A552X1X0_9GAMM|nr:peptidoglycan DD-metalloendopeptidase family protein [Aliidiomarina halalkaliphila]TRW48975.1 peptidoglycan DD-metalloendopeptidase family protein [Aliidiomarina halalkaliphila]